MGTIRVEGKSERLFQTDMIIMHISFEAKSSTECEAIRITTENCENFLNILSNRGFNLNCISIEGVNVKKIKENFVEYIACRNIKIRYKADLKVSNTLIDIIRNCNFDALFRFDFGFTDEQKISKDLIKLAYQDALDKANLIAEATGMTLVGVKDINRERVYNIAKSVCVEEFYDFKSLVDADSKTPLTDMLNLPFETKSESISVEWVAE